MTSIAGDWSLWNPMMLVSTILIMFPVPPIYYKRSIDRYIITKKSTTVLGHGDLHFAAAPIILFLLQWYLTIWWFNDLTSFTRRKDGFKNQWSMKPIRDKIIRNTATNFIPYFSNLKQFSPFVRIRLNKIDIIFTSELAETRNYCDVLLHCA